MPVTVELDEKETLAFLYSPLTIYESSIFKKAARGCSISFEASGTSMSRIDYYKLLICSLAVEVLPDKTTEAYALIRRFSDNPSPVHVWEAIISLKAAFSDGESLAEAYQKRVFAMEEGDGAGIYAKDNNAGRWGCAPTRRFVRCAHGLLGVFDVVVAWTTGCVPTACAGCVPTARDLL
jgi:hypothetical protein